MLDRTLWGAMFYAIIHADGETLRSLAGHWVTSGTEPDQGGYVRTPAGRPTGRTDI